MNTDLPVYFVGDEEVGHEDFRRFQSQVLAFVVGLITGAAIVTAGVLAGVTTSYLYAKFSSVIEPAFWAWASLNF